MPALFDRIFRIILGKRVCILLILVILSKKTVRSRYGFTSMSMKTVIPQRICGGSSPGSMMTV